MTTALGNPFLCRAALGNPFPCRKVCFAQRAPLDKPPLRLPEEFSRTHFRVNFAFLFCGIFWAILLGKSRGRKSTEKIHNKLQIKVRELRRRNPHCKNLALTRFWLSQISTAPTRLPNVRDTSRQGTRSPQQGSSNSSAGLLWW